MLYPLSYGGGDRLAAYRVKSAGRVECGPGTVQRSRLIAWAKYSP